MNKWLPKSEIPVLVRTWMDRGDVYAPMGRPNPTAFGRLSEVSQAVLDVRLNTAYPPKSLFLPQSQVLFKASADTLFPVEEASPPAVVLGIRGCDLRALNLLDEVFLGGKYVDPYWKAKRENTAIISLACLQPCRDCFCTAVGVTPVEERGADAILIDQGQGYLVEVISERGRQLFEPVAEAGPLQIDEAMETRQAAESALTAETLPLSREQVRDRLYALYSEDFWSEIQEACLGCGVCTFLCPTCHCFDIVDESQRGERVRNWDTCMFRIYSQEASGHNPRSSNLERTRNRIMHKYAYFSDRHSAFGCTGCGRCVRYCPVNIDIRRVVLDAMAFKIA